MGRPAHISFLVAALAAACALAGGSRIGEPGSTDLRASAARSIPHSDVTPSAARLAGAASAWSGGAIATSTGEMVTVYVSSTLPAELGTAETWAEFLVHLVHGPELATLTAYIAPLSEIADICGPRSLGCYGANRMAAMGETMYGITAAEVVRHEYGHHVAGNRLNPPWSAIDWGPKNWASGARICRRATDGTAYPGDEGDHYELNPGEAWAETYRLMDERKSGASGSGWGLIDSSFYPDEPALQAAELDVSRPWTAGSRTTYRHRFTATSKQLWSIPVATPLDGEIAVTIRLPKGGVHDVVLVDRERKAVVGTALWSGASEKRFTTTLCGTRSLLLKVRRRGAYGQVVATVEKP
jgi:hypothetical protein